MRFQAFQVCEEPSLLSGAMADERGGIGGSAGPPVGQGGDIAQLILDRSRQGAGIQPTPAHATHGGDDFAPERGQGRGVPDWGSQGLRIVEPFQGKSIRGGRSVIPGEPAEADAEVQAAPVG